MKEQVHQDARLVAQAQLISRHRKARLIRSMSEDEFRDQVVRPLLLRLGLRDGRDLCGPDEQGKDAVFIDTNKLGIDEVWAIQTKKGNLTLASSASTNVLNAITQLKTALETPVSFVHSRQSVPVSRVLLCVSGKINQNAREHIVSRVCDNRLYFFDIDDIVPNLDLHLPEVWLGIDTTLLPYLRALRSSIEDASTSLPMTELPSGAQMAAAATDSMFVPLRLWTSVATRVRRGGETRQASKLVELPIHGLLSVHRRLALVTGEAGSGKSTAIRRLAYELAGRRIGADNGSEIPVLLRASDIAAGQSSSLLELCTSEAGRLAGAPNGVFSLQDLLTGKLVVLIDALDEIPDERASKRAIETILEFHARYPNCRIVLTAREYAYARHIAELSAFQVYRLYPLDFSQAEQIIDRLQRGGALPAENAKELVRRLQDVHGIELNPLLVTVFAVTNDFDRRDVPANITELFAKFTELMLGRWDLSKGVALQYQAALKVFLLSRVAFEMHRRGTTSIDIDEFGRFFEAELKKRALQRNLEQLLEETLQRSGLFRRIGRSVEFRHLLLQEYFAGKGIPSIGYLATEIGNEWWRRAAVFFFGSRPGEGADIAQLLSSVATRPAAERFEAAVSLGLALQACYLVEVDERIEILKQIIEVLAVTREGSFQDVGLREGFRLSRFLCYYLFGRDAVALSMAGEALESLVAPWAPAFVEARDEEYLRFWVIVALMESGHMEKAEALIRRFKPEDERLLLAIHLGAFLIQELRVTGRTEKESARRVCGRLASRVEHLRKELLHEVRSELLEIQQREVRALTAGPAGNRG